MFEVYKDMTDDAEPYNVKTTQSLVSEIDEIDVLRAKAKTRRVEGFEQVLNNNDDDHAVG